MKHLLKEVRFKLLKITSSAFGDNELIPAQYTCDEKNISPPLSIEHVPVDAKSLALIVDDPDAPGGIWVHWIVWNIPVTQHLQENIVHGEEGLNDFQQYHYGGPCPPSGTHRYFFKVYALDTILHLPASTNKLQLEKAMSEHIIAFGEIIGLYKKQPKS